MSRRADLKRLRRELEIILSSIDQDLGDEEPGLSRKERRERARSKLLQLVDDAVREVTAAW